MKRAGLILALLIFAPAPQAAAVTNPHVDTADGSSCLFCHVKGFDPNAASKIAESLVEESVDAVCLRCHTKTECCVIGQRHQGGLELGKLDLGISHVSDIDEGDMQRESSPLTLPLHEGKMTCNTCHFHRRPAGRDYKLVRIVAITDTGVSWAGLCQDCHKTQ